MPYDFYIDDSGLIFAESNASHLTGPAGSDAIDLSISDAPALSTMSTWLINRIKFQVSSLLTSVAVPGTFAELDILGGVMQSGVSGLITDFEDYQDIKGWPIKGAKGYMLAFDNPQQMYRSWSYTWTPSRGNHLALNRLQDINLAIKDSGNGTWTSHLRIVVEAKRGQ